MTMSSHLSRHATRMIAALSRRNHADCSSQSVRLGPLGRYTRKSRTTCCHQRRTRTCAPAEPRGTRDDDAAAVLPRFGFPGPAPPRYASIAALSVWRGTCVARPWGSGERGGKHDIRAANSTGSSGHLSPEGVQEPTPLLPKTACRGFGGSGGSSVWEPAGSARGTCRKACGAPAGAGVRRGTRPFP